MNCLVVGYGSIGARHARILQELGFRVAVISRRKVPFPVLYKDIPEALQKEQPDYVVIANRTDQHYHVLEELGQHGFQGLVLVEKPLFHELLEVPANRFKMIYVGYNLRFHPVLQALREQLSSQRIVSVHAYVGQYLPDWRPGIDYRQSYSAMKEQGGGVLRDLSHELDSVRWLFGDWKRIVALGGHFSDLQINSDDIYHLLLQTQFCPLVSVHLNLLDRAARREMVVHTQDGTIQADLLTSTLYINGERIAHFDFNRDETYRAQHLAILNGDERYLCTAEEGMKVLEMIAAAEKSNEQRAWISQ